MCQNLALSFTDLNWVVADYGKKSENWKTVINYLNCPKKKAISLYNAFISQKDTDDMETEPLITLLLKEQFDLGLYCLFEEPR